MSVISLTERDALITALLSRPEVQYIGSTSGCGCDFPHVTLTRGEWVGYAELVVDDPEWEATERVNREALVALLQQSGEETIELYGIWEGNRAEPHVRDEIPLTKILDPNFRFKERGLYTVIL